MRNTYKKLSMIGLILVVISFASCKKLLEQEPKNSTYLEVYWKSAKDARNAIAGNYALLRNACTNKENRYYMYGDAIAKNYFTIQYNGDGLEGIQNGDFTFQYNLNSLANYTLYYKTIAMSNIVIANVSKMTSSELKDVEDPETFKNGIIGQALFIRALSYFMMVRVWGDVPLVTAAYDDPITAPQLPRSSKTVVMKQIEDDCHNAAKMLSWSYESAGDAKVTANRGSVYALLAHLYLWRATMTDVSTDVANLVDVNSADTTINTLIARGGYTQTDTTNYSNTFIGRSPEGIFELNMSENTLEGSSSHIGTRFLNTSYISYYNNTPRFYVVPRYLTDQFGTGTITDIRYRKNFDLVTPDKPLCVKYSNVIYRNPGQKLDAYLSNNMIIFRLSDLKLLKAEIALYKGDAATATTIINDFRTKYDKVPKKVAAGLSVSAVMDEYIKERGKEMFLEGHLFYDLLRTRKYGNIVDWLPVERFRREGFYWPIDPALFRENPNLKQTTYWLGKV
ncbi:RagB/SusD family nutrient uptake outer membrane protein [Pedobacter sp. GSP4]|uniref:RagB/SusD family nutrient uptake outer membrane protein n=1 Tax=Pedobacter sp. GSP4 TaxID=3453716 RepID=UPI003EE9D598